MSRTAGNMNTNNEPKRYAGGRLRDVLDPWREMLFRCENCGLESLGKDLDPGDLHQSFFTKECPDCAHNVVSISLPHVTEMLGDLGDLTPETREEVFAFAGQSTQWQREKLHRIEQLPEINLDHIVLVWDTDDEGQERSEPYGQIIIRCGEREIYRGPSSWGHYAYVIDACKVLRRKYGNRLHDVIPTERTFSALWGDELRAPEIVEGMRERLRKASRIENWTNLPIDPSHSWETYGA